MGFTNQQSLITEAVGNGKTWETNFYKVGPVEAAGAAGHWYDVSSWGGNPRPNGYPAGLFSTPLSFNAVNGAICPGPSMLAIGTGTTFSVDSFLRFVDSSLGFKFAGFHSGMSITVSGFNNSGNNRTFTIATVTSNLITVTNTNGMIVESNAGQIITFKSVGSDTKFLTKTTIFSNNANLINSCFLLCDYLMFYNFFDMSLSSFQGVTNNTSLQRYASGNGVQMFMVSTNDVGSNGSQMVVTYTNSNGVSNQQSQPVFILPPTTTNISSIPYTGITISPMGFSNGPFIPLAPGDVGVQNIQGVQLSSSTGSGYGAIVLAYPLFYINNRSTVAPTELEVMIDTSKMPQIQDNAYLNFLMYSGAAIASNSTIIGNLEFSWGNL